MYATPEFGPGLEPGVVSEFAVLVMWTAFWGAAISVFIGAGLGMVDGVLSGAGKLAATGALLGAAVGLAGGAVGDAFGQTVFSLMLGAARGVGGGLDPDRVTLTNMLLRSIGFAVAGAALGTAQGLVVRSYLRARWGAQGGAIGGLVAGFLFLPVSWATTQFFGMFFNVTRDQAALYRTTDVIDTFVYRALRQMNDLGMSAAVGVYQSIVGFVLVLVVNWVVRRIDPDKALF